MPDIEIGQEARSDRRGRYVTRKNGFRILPLCPYVPAQYRKNPDWVDVMALAPGEEPDFAAPRRE